MTSCRALDDRLPEQSTPSRCPFARRIEQPFGRGIRMSPALCLLLHRDRGEHETRSPLLGGRNDERGHRAPRHLSPAASSLNLHHSVEARAAPRELHQPKAAMAVTAPLACSWTTLLMG